MEINQMHRIFKHKNLKLPDPGAEMTPERALSFYANTYPELTVARIEGPVIEEGKAIYTFVTTLGTKG
ncbi:MAG TPA: PRTRC system protein C [bacterium]|nr:PRTRC system protein C [bacterium]